MRSGRPQDSDTAIGKLVAARLDRQVILTGGKPALAWYVIDEGALRHAVGGPAVMSAQLDRLIEVAGLPGIVIQVLPFRARDNAGADGSITIYESALPPHDSLDLIRRIRSEFDEQ